MDIREMEAALVGIVMFGGTRMAILNPFSALLISLLALHSSGVYGPKMAWAGFLINDLRHVEFVRCFSLSMSRESVPIVVSLSAYRFPAQTQEHFKQNLPHSNGSPQIEPGSPLTGDSHVSCPPVPMANGQGIPQQHPL
jgi:hypothetical protein